MVVFLHELQILASKESLIEPTEESESDDAILMSQVSWIIKVYIAILKKQNIYTLSSRSLSVFIESSLSG